MAPNIGGHWCGGVVLRGCEAGTRQLCAAIPGRHRGQLPRQARFLREMHTQADERGTNNSQNAHHN
jgi:hypothetical protein